MRYIEFTEVKLYDLCYEGLVTTSTKGIETRILAKVLTKLEEVGTAKGTTGLYTLATAGYVQLEDAEHALTVKLLSEVMWNGIGAKNAASLMDLLDDAPNTPLTLAGNNS